MVYCSENYSKKVTKGVIKL